MRQILDYSYEMKITNTEQLARGTGLNLLLVIESPYPNEYAAIRWLRTMPESTKRCQFVVRFGTVPSWTAMEYGNYGDKKQ